VPDRRKESHRHRQDRAGPPCLDQRFVGRRPRCIWDGESPVIVNNRAGPWRSADAVDLATAERVHFWNTRRRPACGDVPSAEFEAAYHQRLPAPIEAA
jgi:hypothetical protein